MCKLVRDKVPQKSNNSLEFQSVEPEELCKALDERLQQDVDKYLETKSMEAMAGILEVLSSILHTEGKTLYDLEKVRIERYIEEGGFEKGFKIKEA